MVARPLFGSVLASALCATLLVTGRASADAPPAPPAKPAQAPPDAAATDAKTYAVRLAELERRIEEMKKEPRANQRRETLRLAEIQQRIDALRKNLATLQRRVEELARRDPAAPAPPPVKPATAISSLENRLAAMRLTRVRVLFDGALVLDNADAKFLAGRELPLFIGAVAPGEHTVAVQIEAAPAGHGVFVYADQLHFTTVAVQKLTFNEGKDSSVRVRVFEKGGVTVPFADRLAVGIATVDKRD